MEVGRRCSDLSSCWVWTLVLSPTLLSNFLEKGCLCLIHITGEKSNLHKWCFWHQVSHKKTQIGKMLPCCFSSGIYIFFLLLSFTFFIAFFAPALDHPGRSTSGGSKDWWYCLFFSLALPKQSTTIIFYSILRIKVCCGSGEYTACVMVCCGLWARPVRSFWWELRTYWRVLNKIKDLLSVTCKSLMYKFTGLLASTFSV